MAERWDYRNREDVRGYDYERDRHRGAAERAGDEVRSWFGDDEAARRRRIDEMRDDRGWKDRDRSADHDRWNDYDRNAAERAWDRTREAARDVTDRDRDGRRGLAEWKDNDTARYANVDPYAPPWSGRRDWNTPDYTGLGPKGYRRSDARLFEEICDRLTVDRRVDASDIDVKVENGEVTLSGSVRSREEKRYAEEDVERVMGVAEVNNHLKVTRPEHVLGTARSGASSVLGLTDTPPPSSPRK